MNITKKLRKIPVTSSRLVSEDLQESLDKWYSPFWRYRKVQGINLWSSDYIDVWSQDLILNWYFFLIFVQSIILRLTTGNSLKIVAIFAWWLKMIRIRILLYFKKVKSNKNDNFCLRREKKRLKVCIIVRFMLRSVFL